MLARLSDDMVRAKKQFFGKGPEQAKSYMLDDMLFVVMRGGLTTAEQTMLRFGRQNMVRQFRQLFENEMTEVLTGLVEEATGRTVVNYQSQIMFDPDIIVEMFVFADPRQDGIEATAEGQLKERRPAPYRMRTSAAIRHRASRSSRRGSDPDESRCGSRIGRAHVYVRSRGGDPVEAEGTGAEARGLTSCGA